MKTFHAEKRLAGHSLIAREGEEQPHRASEDPEFAALFQPAAETPDSTPQLNRFGARSEASVSDIPLGHFVIVADMKERSITPLEEEIFAMGTAHQVGPQAWALSSQASINMLRTALIQKLGKTDTLFIVDSVNDKVAWFNYGPEADARVRKMWSRPAEHRGGEKRATTRT
jgi:hypothetical protein